MADVNRIEIMVIGEVEGSDLAEKTRKLAAVDNYDNIWMLVDAGDGEVGETEVSRIKIGRMAIFEEEGTWRVGALVGRAEMKATIEEIAKSEGALLAWRR